MLPRVVLSKTFFCPDHPSQSCFQGSSFTCPDCNKSDTHFKTFCDGCSSETELSNFQNHLDVCQLVNKLENFKHKHKKRKIYTSLSFDSIVVLVGIGKIESMTKVCRFIALNLDIVFPKMKFELILHDRSNKWEDLIFKLQSSSVLPPYQKDLRMRNLERDNRTIVNVIEHIVFVIIFDESVDCETMASLKALNISGHVRKSSFVDSEKYFYRTVCPISEIQLLWKNQEKSQCGNDTNSSLTQLIDFIQSGKKIDRRF